jgi:hypothetical protein
MRQQQPGVETRIIDAGFAQERGAPVERFKRGNRGAEQAFGQAAGLAARFAWVRSSRRLRARASTVRRALDVLSR